ncbi:very short patch repair endonuclease [Microbacterium sp. USHLN186]|uniref:very short patch repair endonuclease n=1 Tax=Microbacterium sp. USHLN186 TaxID=3081286 RepID=UPI0030184053
MATSWASSENSRRTMRANRRRDTRPELSVRRRLHARGWRYRVDFRLAPPLRVRADIVFTRVRVAVFIDGCFWHSCPTHATAPKANSHYWGPKLARNVERDRDTDRALADLGWRVLRFWEHEDVDAIVARIELVLSAK